MIVFQLLKSILTPLQWSVQLSRSAHRAPPGDLAALHPRHARLPPAAVRARRGDGAVEAGEAEVLERSGAKVPSGGYR